LHGGGQNAQINKAGIQLGADVDRRPPFKQHAQRRENNEGAEHHPQMQPPVVAAGQNGFARQLGAVHKEQQGNGGDGQCVQPADELAARRQERSQQHGGDQRQGKAIG
jgi:hypothetical protein